MTWQQQGANLRRRMLAARLLRRQHDEAAARGTDLQSHRAAIVQMLMACGATERQALWLRDCGIAWTLGTAGIRSALPTRKPPGC